VDISCICVTQPGRERFLDDAVADFDAQSYPRHKRELVIVRDPKDGVTLGGLRNHAMGNASGQYVCTWDDDDRYHPDRLISQLSALLKHDADMCMLQELEMQCSCSSQFISHSRKTGWECSMMADRSKIEPYPLINEAEDHKMILGMVANGVRTVVMENASDLYRKVYHGENTIDRDGHRVIFRRAGHMCRDLARVAVA